ncbi:MAG TPA: O-antigen ligase family protein [Terriglobales bacterium]|nr:O-antigen ligase family protein [Terriglobales bacterium]
MHRTYLTLDASEFADSQPSLGAHNGWNAVLLFASLALLMFAVLAFGATEEWSIFVFRTGSISLLTLWITAKAASGQISLRHNPVYFPAGVFLIIATAQSLFGATAYRYATTSELLDYIAYAALLFVVSQSIRDDRDCATFLYVLTVFGFCLAVFALLQGLTSKDKIYWLLKPAEGGWIYGPYVNKNHYAGLMEMLAPIPVVTALVRRTTAQRVLLVFAGVVMATTVITSQSRAGMLAFAIEIGVLAIFAFRRNKGPQFAIAAAVALLALAALLSWLGGLQLFERFLELQDASRSSILRDSIAMVRQEPFWGWGLGTFPLVYPQFRSFYTNLFVNAAHNDVLQLLIETGFVGLSVATWFVVATFRKAVDKLNYWSGSYRDCLTLSATVGCTGLLVHSFFDFNLHIPANAAFFYVLCSLAAARFESRP